MNLLPLTSDFVFKSVFAKLEESLRSLINSLPSFENRQIESLKVLNPEIPRDNKTAKSIILDIKAIDFQGNKFLIEMQASSKPLFQKRVLYSWSKEYSKSLGKGEDYSKLPKIYSISFLNYEMYPKIENFYWSFQISSKQNPEIILTNDFQLDIIEIPKFEDSLKIQNSEFQNWMYLFKYANQLKEKEMKTLQKQPAMKKVLTELKFLSQDKKSRDFYDDRLKAELDYNTGIVYNFQKGKEEGEEIGIKKGEEIGSIDSLHLSIELLLKSKYKSDSNSLLPKIKKIKEVNFLKQLFQKILDSKNLTEVKNFLNQKK
jgi:predicted transposase/invertase (TIGR01784 family)